MITKKNIDAILSKAPALIARHTELENKAYAEMVNKHEEHKRVRAKLYLEKRAREGQVTVKDIEYELDFNEELASIKDAELKAEVDYRSHRQKRQYYENMFEAARSWGANVRAELRSLDDTIRRG